MGEDSTERLDPAVEALFPKDAPSGHESYTTIRWEDSRWPAATFRYGHKPFRITLGKAGSKEAALRLARACYLRLERGDTPEKVRVFMDDIYSQIKRTSQREENAVGRKRKKTGAEEPPEDSETKVKGKKKDEEEAGAKEVVEARRQNQDDNTFTPNVFPVIDGIVLTEEARAAKIKFAQNHQTGLGCFWFTFRQPDGTQERFQTTVKSAGRSAEAAEHIARLCYAKFQTGASKAEVEEFRRKHYDVVAQRFARRGSDVTVQPQESGGSRNAARHESATEDPTVVQKLQQERGLDGALRLSGRDAQKKHAGINGIYAPHAEGFEGNLAFKKVDGKAPLYIYYSSRKGRWKIHEGLDGAAAGFAFTAGSRNAPPGPSQTWTVFDGGGKGFNEDAEVRCELLTSWLQTHRVSAPSNDLAGRESPKEAPDPVSGASEPKALAPATVPEADEADEADEPGPAAPASSSTSSAGSSSDSSDERGELPPAPVVTAPIPAPAAPTTRLSSNGAGRGRACAKMLVRSGLRCGCHFFYQWHCPARRLVDAG